MLVYTRQKNIAQVFILKRYFFDVYILASRTRLQMKHRNAMFHSFKSLVINVLSRKNET